MLRFRFFRCRAFKPCNGANLMWNLRCCEWFQSQRRLRWSRVFVKGNGGVGRDREQRLKAHVEAQHTNCTHTDWLIDMECFFSSFFFSLKVQNYAAWPDAGGDVPLMYCKVSFSSMFLSFKLVHFTRDSRLFRRTPLCCLMAHVSSAQESDEVLCRGSAIKLKPRSTKGPRQSLCLSVPVLQGHCSIPHGELHDPLTDNCDKSGAALGCCPKGQYSTQQEGSKTISQVEWGIMGSKNTMAY